MVTNQTVFIGQPSDERYRLLFEQLPVCIFVADIRRSPVTILEVNKRATLVYGYTSADLVGAPASKLVPEDLISAALNILQRARQGEWVTAEITNERRDGTQFPVRIIAALDPTDNGRLIASVQDITAETQRRSETAAIDAERRRIAREIHDGVAQSLAGLRFKSALWSHLAETAPPAIRTALEELEQELLTTINDLRRAIFALEPVDLESKGFFPAISQLVEDFGHHNEVLAGLCFSGVPQSLPTDYELPLFRIIQEGLNNISRHAHAGSVKVRLLVDAVGAVIVSIQDNGCGFEPTQLNQIEHDGHFGLRQMRERILDRGGTLDVCTAPGQGTELFVTLPPCMNKANNVPN